MNVGLRLYAHRGAASERPENTIPSFQRALDLGVSALEMDLHITRDGHVIVSHDPNARRMTGIDREFRSSTWPDVQTWDAGYGFIDSNGDRPFAGIGITVPSFDQVLSEFPGIPLNVDIKQASPSIVIPVLEQIARHRATERVTIASFHLRTLVEVRLRGYGGSTAFSPPEIGMLWALPQTVLARIPKMGDAVQVPRSVGPIPLNRSIFIDKCHKLGFRVDFWTINDPAEGHMLLSLGADGLMTDDPASLVPVFEKWRNTL